MCSQDFCPHIFFGHAHAYHVFTELTPAQISMVMLMPAVRSQTLCPRRVLWSRACLPWKSMPALTFMIMLMPAMCSKNLRPHRFPWPCSRLPCARRTYARTDFYGQLHACHVLTELMPAQISMVMLTPAVEVHACTDFYAHAHACQHRFLWSRSCLHSCSCPRPPWRSMPAPISMFMLMHCRQDTHPYIYIYALTTCMSLTSAACIKYSL